MGADLLGALIGATATIIVAMTIGFFGLYNRLATMMADVRILTEKDDEHGRSVAALDARESRHHDDHEKRIRELEERIRTSRDRGMQ